MENDAALKAVAKGTDTFANKYFKVLSKNYPGNLITSPLSAQVVLAMTAYGAASKTAAQMRSALKIPRNNQLGKCGYHSLIKTLNNEKGVELRLAQKMYTASTFEVKPAYKEMTTESFLSTSQELDFTDPVAAAKIINDWCEEQSNHRITDAVSPDQLPRDTLIMLVNAVYFKGQWDKPFDPLLTKNKPFHVDENTVKRLPTMFIEKPFRTGDLPKLDARFIEIPYEGKQLSMIIILPNELNGIQKVVDNLHKVNLKRSLENEFYTRIELYLPKFKITSDFNLTPVLQKLGMTSMFRADQANFSHIADVPLRIMKVVQSAFIEVNEEGTEAFAFTRLMGGGAAPPLPILPFKVDRPFYYAIYHLDTGISLFTGIVQHPSYK